MFTVNSEELTIHATRGDTVFFLVTAEKNGEDHTFQAGDVVRFKVYGKKNAENVVLQKDFPIESETQEVYVTLTEQDTKIGEVISKPTDYWYEVELNPFTNPQTIIGYDEDGPKVFKLYPEGDDVPEYVPDPEDVRVIDTELDMTSTRPVQNQAIARGMATLKGDFAKVRDYVTEQCEDTAEATAKANSDIAVERARIDNLVSGATPDGAEVTDIRVGADGKTYASAGTAVRAQFNALNTKVAMHLNQDELLNAIAASIEIGKQWDYTKGAVIASHVEANGDRSLISVYKNWYDVKMSVAPDYMMSLIYLDDYHLCQSETGWIDDPVTIPANTYYAVNLRRKDNAPFTAAEIADIVYAEMIDPAANALQEFAKPVENRLIALESLSDDGILMQSVSESITMDTVWNVTIGSPIVRENLIGQVRASSEILKYGKEINIGIASGYLASVLFLDADMNCVSETGWTSASTSIPKNQMFAVNIRKSDGSAMPFGEVQNALIATSVEVNQGEVLRSTTIEYGRYNGASYVFVRVPYTSYGGKAIRPVVALTSADGSLTGAKKSALQFAKSNGTEVTINAGLFDVASNQPVGQTIIDGVSVTNKPMSDDNGTPISEIECYPLCIDADGKLSADYARNVNTADMIADGVKFSVTGWGKIIDNFEASPDTVENEIVHDGKYIRQVIGQFQNMDYFICTVDQSRGHVENEAGLTYKELAQLLIDKGVKFAYSLDGGGSAETVMGVHQVNPIYEGAYGRPVPTIITFKAI